MYYDCDTKKNRRTTTQRHEFSMFAEQVLNWSQSIKNSQKLKVLIYLFQTMWKILPTIPSTVRRFH